MIIKTILSCLCLLWLTTTRTLAQESNGTTLAQESNGWDLDNACMPVGEVSTAIFKYANTTDSASITLTAFWGNGTEKKVVDVEMGGTTGTTTYEFTHTHAKEGTVVTSFIAEQGAGKLTVPKVCNITAGTGAATSAAGSSNMIISRNTGVALAAVVLSYLFIKL